MPVATPAIARALDRVLVDDGCWQWTGNKSRFGYGKIFESGREIGVHRAFYEFFRAPIAAGLEIDHLCRNRGCVRPSHLEPVSSRVNTLRGTSPIAVRAAWTHCMVGHEFTTQNTRITRKGERQCRTCDRDRHRRDYANRRSNR